MAEDLGKRLKALMPSCCLCSNEITTHGFELHLLQCGHVFCQYCLPDLCSQSGYFCPLDNSPVPEQSSEPVYLAMNLASRMQYHSDTSKFRSALEQLRVSYSRVKVPCKQYFLTNSCPFYPECDLDHNEGFFRKWSCPLPSPCWRGEICLFSHLAEGTVKIKSASLLRKIASGFPAYQEIITRYNIQSIEIQSYEITYYPTKKWVYEDKQSYSLPIAFDPDTQSQIQYAIDHFRSNIEINGFKLFFKPLFLITNETKEVFKVACTSECTATSQAGVLKVTIKKDWVEPFIQEIEGLEIAVEGAVVGNQQMAWLKDCGFGMMDGYIIGDTESLREGLVRKPGFNEYDDIIEAQVNYDARVHNISGRTVEIFEGKIVGLREDVTRILTQTNNVSPPVSAPVPPVYAPVPPVYAPVPPVYAPVDPVQVSIQPDQRSMYSMSSMPGGVQLGQYPPPVVQPASRRPEVAQFVPRPRPQSGERRRPQPTNIAPRNPAPSHSDSEVDQIRAQIMKNMPFLKFIQISKVTNNAKARKRFEGKMQELKRAGSYVRTWRLFHGTQEDDPADLVSSVEGLNRRMRRRGMYFYEMLRSVSGYSYTLEDGSKQTLLCDVIEDREHSDKDSKRGSTYLNVLEEDMALPVYLITYS